MFIIKERIDFRKKLIDILFDILISCMFLLFCYFIDITISITIY